MRDTVEFLKQGVPVVMVCQEVFENAAKSLSRTLGYPDMPLVIVEQPKGWQTHEEERRKAQEAVDKVVSALTAPVPQAVSR